ncbi:MAG: ATP-binding protein [Bacteroidota bacterium]
MTDNIGHFKTEDILDVRIYRNSLLLASGLVLLLFITNLIFGLYTIVVFVFYPLAIFIFLGFYYFNRTNVDNQLQYILLSFTMILIIDLGWLLGYGSTIASILVYLLIIIYSILIFPGKYINHIVVFVIINIVVVCGMELLLDTRIRYFDNTLGFHPFMVVFALMAFGSSLAIMMFFRTRFDKERIVLLRKGNELDRLTYSYEEQNERLAKYNDELNLLNSSIKQKNKELKTKQKGITIVKENLLKRVKRRTERLEKRNKELDLIFYQSSHDFRRPLTSLLGLKEFAENYAKGDAKELLELVGDTATEMDNMLQKFLMLYNINHYKDNSQNIVLDKVLGMLGRKVESRKGTLEIINRCSSAGVKSIRNILIRPILVNLIENSLYYVKPNELPRIRVEAYQDNGYCVFSVTDQGLGIPNDFHDKVFGIYFKGSSISKGNGLGLYVVKRAIDALKGTIELESVDGEYTKFTVRYQENLTDD